MPKKASAALSTLIMAIFALVVVVVLMQQMRKNMTIGSTSSVSAIQLGCKDSTYYHAPLKFLLQLPNSKWHCTRLADTMTVMMTDTSAALWPQVHWLARFDRLETDTVAQCRVGLLNWPTPVSHFDLALNLLAEKLAKVEKSGQRATILQEVTSPAHQAFPSSYFVLIIPSSVAPPTALIVCTLTRQQWVYIIEMVTLETNYDHLRPELQRLVRGFRSYVITR